MASNKMKNMKNSGNKEGEEQENDEDNEELFGMLCLYNYFCVSFILILI